MRIKRILATVPLLTIPSMLSILSIAPFANAGKRVPVKSQLAHRKVASQLPENAREVVDLAPGLTRFEFSCTVNDHPLRFEELRLEPGNGLELRALHNPEARPNPRCRQSYGGPDLETLLRRTQPTSGTENPFETLAATNGNLFRTQYRRGEEGQSVSGYASNHLLWSKGAGLIAPLMRRGGESLFVADSQGGHELRIRFESCGRRKTCARLTRPYPTELASAESRQRFSALSSSDAWITALQVVYPTMTLAIQANMPLSGGRQRRGEPYQHYTQCPTDEEGRPRAGDWRCARAPRTILCARIDGSISLITTPGAYPYDLAVGLRSRGVCQTQCWRMYNLDGGGSTQMGYRSPGSESQWVFSGNRQETSEPGCSPYRPVDHYLVMGRVR